MANPSVCERQFTERTFTMHPSLSAPTNTPFCSCSLYMYMYIAIFPCTYGNVSLPAYARSSVYPCMHAHVFMYSHPCLYAKMH